jgi:exodeoxyribonuclease VII small subunit
MTPPTPPSSRGSAAGQPETGAAQLPGGPAADLPNLTYEQARAALEAVVTALEAATVTLEDSLALWERGNHLADIAQGHLDGARNRIAALRPDLIPDNP